MSAGCPVCRHTSVVVCFEKRGVEIMRCEDCGLRYWVPGDDFQPADVYDARYFESSDHDRGYDDYAGQESVLRTNFARRLARLPRPSPGTRLLDIGAAYGFAVAEAAERGFVASGLEISLDAARRAGAAAPGRVVAADALRAPFASGSFDVVTLWDVLEHLADPHVAIAEAARLLRPGGRLVLTTGDVGSLVARLSGRRWHLYTLPEHLFFHTRSSLLRLFEAHGLEVRTMRSDASHYTLGYVVERLRKTLLGRPSSGPPKWPGARLPIPINLFDIVCVEARAPGP